MTIKFEKYKKNIMIILFENLYINGNLEHFAFVRKTPKTEYLAVTQITMLRRP